MPTAIGTWSGWEQVMTRVLEPSRLTLKYRTRSRSPAMRQHVAGGRPSSVIECHVGGMKDSSDLAPRPVQA